MYRYIRSVFVCTIVFVQCCAFSLQAQTLTQTVRGKIVDEDSQTPLPGANVIVAGMPHLAASTGADGYFRIEKVPVGRITLHVTFIGYEDRIIPNILVTSGKETVLDLSLKESYVMMDALVVDSDIDKTELSNEMALTSARVFTVEETKRYAGSFNDPARMVSAYAGVTSDPAGDNYIIVRGNSPKGIQWRLEGIDIPNPNHFSEEGATGGPINALNSQMLSNSEFYTGAFPAEYGNALSGVFDMKLRKGNNERHEQSFSIGVLGTDITLEGPFSKAKKSSYLVNYRYSTLSLLDALNLVDFGGIPKYQDLSFKVHLDGKKLGTFSIFGLGGLSSITSEEFADDDETKLVEREEFSANLGVVGVTQYWPLSQRTYLQNSVTMSRNGSAYEESNLVKGAFMDTDEIRLDKYSVKAAAAINHKINVKHLLQGGLIYTRHTFDFYTKYYDEEIERMVINQDTRGEADHYQGYFSWKYRPWEDLSIVSGIHAQQISMDHAFSIEPRASIRWQLNEKQALTAGFGIHGKMESLPNYYSLVETGENEYTMPNRKIGFSKARHYVVGYENKLSPNLFFKAEAYYQQLYNIPVENDPGSSYSLINQISWFTDRALVSKGSGTNVGVELTLERFFANDYYFLITSSLFDSKYKAMDGIERNTLFNGNYIGNLLVGKEFRLPSRNQKKKVFGVNAKISSLGPRRFTPVNVEESIAIGRTVYYEERAFSERADNVFIANLALSYRIDNRRLSQELKLDVQNFTNNDARLNQYYDASTGKIESDRQLPLLPVLIYTINF